MSCGSDDVMLALAGSAVFAVLARLGYVHAIKAWGERGWGLGRAETEARHRAAVEKVNAELAARDKAITEKAKAERQSIRDDIAEELSESPTRSAARKYLDKDRSDR